MGMMDRCWEYETPNPKGYGQHLAVYSVLVGPVPEGMHLHHRCRNKACYNPRHLVPLTPSQHRQEHAKDLPRQRTSWRRPTIRVQCGSCEWAAYRRNIHGGIADLPCPKCGGATWW